MADDNKNNNNPNKVSRHTWIGDEEEMTPFTIAPQATRIVEKQRKKRTGFITQEELENSEIFKIEDRKTTLVKKEDISQTRIYDPLGEHASDDKEETKPEKPAVPKYITFTAPEGAKRKALILAAVLVVVLLIFEISFFAMKSAAAKMPEQAKASVEQTEALKEENASMEQTIETYGDEEEIKELKESWERLREKLGKSE